MAGNRQHLVERARRPAGWTRVLIVSLAAWTSAGDAMAQQRPPLPDAVLAQMNRLDVQCKSAGGRPGNARYVIAQDFTGDGVLDYLLSEGNYACSGRPDLFRRDGEARVEVFVADRTSRAHRAYSEVLTAYRVLAGQPVRLQIARKGPACGQGTPPNQPCGGELAWNGRTFGLAGSANQAPVTPGTRAEGATSPAPSTRGETEAGFLARCRSDLIRRNPSAVRWADDECRGNWQKIIGSRPAAVALLAVLPISASESPSLGAIRERASGVRWEARVSPGLLASGRLGALEITVEGKAQPLTVSMRWGQTGREIPYDIVGAMRLEGAVVQEMSCEKTGVGAGTRVYAGSMAGRAAFTLLIDQQTAPLGNMPSWYYAQVSLNGRHPARGSSSGCDF